jgi:putative sterol carrier protein
MPKIEKGIQDLFGYTDEQVESLKENQIQYIEKMTERTKYNLVAEVVESRNCGWGNQVGDKIVLWGGVMIRPSECTNKDGLCLFAVAPLQPFSQVFLDRVSSGMDPTKSVFKRIKCLDTGVEHCGWGEIVMEVRAELIQPERMAIGSTPAEIFNQIADAFKPEAAAGIDVVFQYNISGPAGGDWFITIKDQKCDISQGQADNSTTIFKLSDEDFVKMMTGELDGVEAFTSGKLIIEGDIRKSQLFSQVFEAAQD